MRASKSLVAVLTVATVGVVGLSAPPLLARQRPEAGGMGNISRVIGALNDCIQGRFQDINDRFGISRVVKIGETPHRFQPESVAEMSSVRALEQARLEVVLYVAGTRVMRPTPALALISDAHARAIVKGPVRVTSGPGTTDGPPPPAVSALWDEGRRAMRAFATGDSHEFTQPGWTFTARPVRASGAACLQCHAHDRVTHGTVANEPVKLGDALGVVFYGYRAQK
jgi:hypothetical protein